MVEFLGYTGAQFSDDKKHRFTLWRFWDLSKGFILFVGLNPSRGNEFYNDQTITRCINFAKSWGYGGIMFGNLFSLRSPKPDAVKQDLDAACHPQNNHHLLRMIQVSKIVVPCWGSWDFIDLRKYTVLDLIRNAGKPTMCFGVNKDGNPKHPVRLSSKTKLIPFTHSITQSFNH